VLCNNGEQDDGDAQRRPSSTLTVHYYPSMGSTVHCKSEHNPQHNEAYSQALVLQQKEGIEHARYASQSADVVRAGVAGENGRIMVISKHRSMNGSPRYPKGEKRVRPLNLAECKTHSDLATIDTCD
jgi:hypothetical protein